MKNKEILIVILLALFFIESKAQINHGIKIYGVSECNIHLPQSII